MSSRKTKKSDFLKAKIIIFLAHVVALFPLTIIRRLGSFVGWLLWRCNTRMAKVSRENIRLCLAHLNESERENLVKKSLIETGKTASEMGVAWLKPLDYSLRQIAAVRGEVDFKNAIAEKRGVIILVPHLSNWEIMNAYINKWYSAASLYRPPRIKPLDDWIRQVRQRSGVKMLRANREEIQLIPEMLKKGENFFILPDQEPGKGHGAFAPFFGVPALTMRLVSRLIQETNSPVMCLYAKRLKKGFEMVFCKADEKIYDPDLLTSQTALNKSIERCIMEAPEQYQWSYKRFKTRPEGEKKLYKF